MFLQTSPLGNFYSSVGIQRWTLQEVLFEMVGLCRCVLSFGMLDPFSRIVIKTSRRHNISLHTREETKSTSLPDWIWLGVNGLSRFYNVNHGVVMVEGWYVELTTLEHYYYSGRLYPIFYMCPRPR